MDYETDIWLLAVGAMGLAFVDTMLKKPTATA